MVKIQKILKIDKSMIRKLQKVRFDQIERNTAQTIQTVARLTKSAIKD